MKSSFVLSIVMIGYFATSPAVGFGHIFSKFRPEASPNWGYGSAGEMIDRLTPRQQLMEALLGEELLEEEVCNGRRCSSNDHCCPGHVCMAFHVGSGAICQPIGTVRDAVDCSSDLDCIAGHMCKLGFCVTSGTRKSYSEPCLTSSECDISSGLCCQIIRKHRQAPRKMCAYFSDAMSCMGSMKIKREIRLRNTDLSVLNQRFNSGEIQSKSSE